MSLSLTHIHITSQIFTVSSLPDGFKSGLIQSFITCVTRTDEALLNGPTSYDKNTSHTFFEPKLLCSGPRRSIIQYSMHNQCSGLFICIMYASHGVDLCTMYDSHGVYLCILLTICMYKFSRCHAIVFHGFSIPMPDFLDNSAGF
jgi:hypothetical protein